MHRRLPLPDAFTQSPETDYLSWLRGKILRPLQACEQSAA